MQIHFNNPGYRKATVCGLHRRVVARSSSPHIFNMTITHPNQTFTGEWKKDHKASDSLDCACELLQLSGMIRGALQKMDKIELAVDDKKFTTKTPLPKLLFISLGAKVEEYPLTGEEREHDRRDNRKGTFKGNLVKLNDGKMKINCKWPGRLEGTATDTYSLSADGSMMTIAAELNVEGKTCKYKSVYNRVKKLEGVVYNKSERMAAS